MKTNLDFLAYNPWVSTKRFNPIGPAATYIYTNVLFYYIDRKYLSSFLLIKQKQRCFNFVKNFKYHASHLYSKYILMIVLFSFSFPCLLLSFSNFFPFHGFLFFPWFNLKYENSWKNKNIENHPTISILHFLFKLCKLHRFPIKFIVFYQWFPRQINNSLFAAHAQP